MVKRKTNRNKRDISVEAIQTALDKRDYNKLIKLSEISNSSGISIGRKIKLWTEIGKHWKDKGNNLESSVAFSAARALNPDNDEILEELFQAINLFLSEFRNDLTVSELESLEYQVANLVDFYKGTEIWNSPAIKIGKHILKRTAYLRSIIKPVTKVPTASKTTRLLIALRENATFEDVKAEYARIMAPIFRELIAEEIESKKAADKSKKNS